MKKKVLIVLPHLGIGGIQVALVNTLRIVDFEKYSITIGVESLKNTDCLNKIPSSVKIIQLLKCDYNEFASIKKIPRELVRGKRIVWIKLVFLSLLNKVFKHYNLYMKNLAKLVIDLPKDDYDFCISYGEPSAFSAHYIPLIKHAKHILWVHGDVNSLNIKKDMIRVYRKYDHFYCVSEAAKRAFISRYPAVKRRVSVFYTPIDKKYIVSMSKAFVMEKCKRIRILTVARLSGEKGIDLALESAKVLKERGLDFEWYICGGGPSEQQYKKFIDDNHLVEYISLVGRVSNPYPYYSWANIYVQPSRSEGYCLALAEASCFDSLYLIATNFETAKEHIKNVTKGVIVEFDPTSIANQIEIFSKRIN